MPGPARLVATTLVLACLAVTVKARTEAVVPGQSTYQQRFASLALACITQQYPNKISHHVTGPGDMAEPRVLYPAFYGCFDWHSSVHGHWLLVRLLHLEAPGVDRTIITTALNKSLTTENIVGEVAYFQPPHRKSFERPYGRAWLLQLTTELREWEDPDARRWLQALLPLENLLVAQARQWLPMLNYAVRSGTHNQTAFAFGLMLDYARTAGDSELENLLVEKIEQFYHADRNCPLGYEPSGEDFLSPCLMEADLLRRVLAPAEYALWLEDFLPAIPGDGSADWLAVGVVLDPTDGKLVHLDGLNLSRAWALENIAASLPPGDRRIGALRAAATRHEEAGLASVTGVHYEGGHWLASFATYLLTQRGL
jgi:hypothetical protein